MARRVVLATVMCLALLLGVVAPAGANSSPTGEGAAVLSSARVLPCALLDHCVVVFGLDADGYPTGNADGAVEFDPLGRMVKNEPWQASYQYNAFGNRVGVTRGGATTKLAWDNNNPLPMLAQQGPAGEEPTRTYRYDPTGAPLSSTHPSGAYGRSWFVTDRQGSARDVMKTDGATAYRHDYQGFGWQETPSKSATRVAPEMGYTGEYTDTFTGAIHLRARDYLGNGAFYAPGPVTLGPPAASVNPYLYVGGRPLTMVDPSGEVPRWLEDLGAGVGRGAIGLTDVALVPGDVLTGGRLFNGVRASDFLTPGAFSYSTVPTGTPTYETSRTETYAANATSFGIGVFIPLDALNAPTSIKNGQYAKAGTLPHRPPARTTCHEGCRTYEPVTYAANTGTKLGWSSGDDIYSLTKAGNTPAWSTVRVRFWKNEAAKPQIDSWSASNLDRMKRGLTALQPRQGRP